MGGPRFVAAARPLVVPDRLGNRLRRIRKSSKGFARSTLATNNSTLTTTFPVFPCCEAAFPIRRRRPKALRDPIAAGETQFQSADTGARQMRIAHPPTVSKFRRGSAPAPHNSVHPVNPVQNLCALCGPPSSSQARGCFRFRERWRFGVFICIFVIGVHLAFVSLNSDCPLRA